MVSRKIIFLETEDDKFKGIVLHDFILCYLHFLRPDIIKKTQQTFQEIKDLSLGRLHCFADLKTVKLYVFRDH